MSTTGKKKKTIKNTNTWRLNNTLLNNQQIIEEIKKKEIKICIETNENENTTTQNLWNSVKAVLRGRFRATQALNDTIDQLDLVDIYRTFHPKTINFIFFSSAHGIFSRIDHILGHKSSLGKFKKNRNNSKHLF